MNMIIKMNSAEHSVEIDGTKFDVPTDSAQRDGLRELVVNYWCKKNGHLPLYPDAVNPE